MPNHDTHIKRLITSYPADAVKLFAPRLIETHGPPVDLIDISTELLPLSPNGRSGFMDVALQCRHADGTSAIILLIEHWSSARKVDHRRVLRYLSELLYRHPDAVVLPIILITDPAKTDPKDRFAYSIAGDEVVNIRFNIVHTTPAWCHTIAHQRNIVAAVLHAVAADPDPVTRACRAVALLATMNILRDADQAAALIAHIQELAIMNDSQIVDFHHRLSEDTSMLSVVDMLKEDFKAEGKAEGEITALLSMVNKGRISMAIAREQLAEWLAEGDIPQDMHDAALKQLGG